jgi:hypothetical protein
MLKHDWNEIRIIFTRREPNSICGWRAELTGRVLTGSSIARRPTLHGAPKLLHDTKHPQTC